MIRALFSVFSLAAIACSGSDEGTVSGFIPPMVQQPTDTTTVTHPQYPVTLHYLALGDSYTEGASVCDDCDFPHQLKYAIEAQLQTGLGLTTIAVTGWTTTNLINAINNQQPSDQNDLVTLLIGVNNQYQHKPFDLYETEFPQLVTTAISLAKGDKDNVIVVSIPDYAYTPYGQGNTEISAEIDQYNNFAQTYCEANGILFVNITDITRNGLQNPDLVALDGLHPSALAYTAFVERLLPKALETLP